MLSAAGKSYREIGQVLKCANHTVQKLLETQQGQEALVQYRKTFQLMAAANAFATQQKAWDRVDGSLDENDAQAFDRWTRGLSAIERISASVAGENKPVSVTAVQVNTAQPSKEEFLELARALGLVVENGT